MSQPRSRVVSLAVALLLASCAPPPPGGIESIEAAARRGAERRERQLGAYEMQAVVRIDGRATGRLPAVFMHVRLASPDRVRVQLRWLLGLLLDAVVRGDTLAAWVPGERLALRVPQVSDTLGVRDPALFLGRALAASWPAPHDAWRAAEVESLGARVAWSERDERWTLRVDRDGRPRELRVARGERALSVRYAGWHGAGAAAWPAHIELADSAGWLRLRCDVEQAHAARGPKRAWFALAIPEDARRLELDDLKRILSSHGGTR